MKEIREGAGRRTRVEGVYTAVAASREVVCVIPSRRRVDHRGHVIILR